VRVSDGDDDAEEDPNGDISRGSSDLELIKDGSNEQILGLRFAGLNIPQGAQILNARIQFTVDQTDDEDPSELRFYVQATG
jgi:hypothetical protein